MYKNGGYAIVSHDDANIYSKVQGAYANQKPILFYDDDNTCYFIDTIKKNDDGDYVLTKGGKTFVVTSNNTLSSEGIVSNPIMENIVDLNGNKRFVEFDVDSNTLPEGCEITYSKISLSGTHLMCVCALSVVNTTVLSGNQIKFKLPNYILDKIYPFQSGVIDTKSVQLYNSAFATQNISVNFQKLTDGVILYLGGLTLNDDRVGRIQFDLLIDNE